MRAAASLWAASAAEPDTARTQKAGKRVFNAGAIVILLEPKTCFASGDHRPG